MKCLATALGAAVLGLVLYERHRSRVNRAQYQHAIDLAARIEPNPVYGRKWRELHDPLSEEYRAANRCD